MPRNNQNLGALAAQGQGLASAFNQNTPDFSGGYSQGPQGAQNPSGYSGGSAYPKIPQRFETFDPRTGQLKQQFQVDFGKKRDLSQMGQLEQQRQQSLLSSNIGSMYGRQAQSQADVRGRLAAQGGLSGGASERIGRAGSRDQMNALQQMYGGHQRNMMGLRQQDIGRQIQGEQYNVGQNLSEIQRAYGGQLAGFDIEAKMRGAQAASDAIRGGQTQDPVSSMFEGNPVTKTWQNMQSPGGFGGAAMGAGMGTFAGAPGMAYGAAAGSGIGSQYY